MKGFSAMEEVFGRRLEAFSARISSAFGREPADEEYMLRGEDIDVEFLRQLGGCTVWHAVNEIGRLSPAQPRVETAGDVGVIVKAAQMQFDASVELLKQDFAGVITASCKGN